MADGKTNVLERVRALLASQDYPATSEFLAPLHPADIAEIVGELEQSDQATLLKILGTEKAAEVLTEIDEHSGQALLELLTDREVVSLLEEMTSDDAVDLISQLPPEKSKQVDALLPAEEREKLHELLEFEEDTAGGIMEVEKAAVNARATIRDAITLVRQLADEIENLQNVYVIDGAARLVGSVRVLDLLLHDPSKPVTEVMDPNVISVPVDMDQEEVANLFGKYDQFILPVVDADRTLVGRITVDDIIDVLEEEASEDIARIAGTDEEEFGETSPLKISRVRLPWLLVALLGQLCNAVIMKHFSAPIETFVALVFFVPLVIGTAGSTGVQSAIVVVREIAVGDIRATRISRRVFREMQVTLLNGLILGVILFALVSVWQGETSLGLLLWGALLAVTIVAAFMGASIPLFMNRLRIDPAIASGPFITVVCDIAGLVIYMSLAGYYVAVVRPSP